MRLCAGKGQWEGRRSHRHDRATQHPAFLRAAPALPHLAVCVQSGKLPKALEELIQEEEEEKPDQEIQASMGGGDRASVVFVVEGGRWRVPRPAGVWVAAPGQLCGGRRSVTRLRSATTTPDAPRPLRGFSCARLSPAGTAPTFARGIRPKFLPPKDRPPRLHLLLRPVPLQQIPAHKVKLVVGAGGEKIKLIQKRAKCRLQVGWAGGWEGAAFFTLAALSWPGAPEMLAELVSQPLDLTTTGRTFRGGEGFRGELLPRSCGSC